MVSKAASSIQKKVTDSNPLPINHFAEIGQILRACAQRPRLTEALLDRLAPHRSYIIGVLPPGLQVHGLISDLTTETDDDELGHQLNQITEEKLKQWIIDDCSLIYGELKREELDAFFAEAGPLLEHNKEFIDLGSGLGKVVMTAAVSLVFESYLGVELIPYRHKLAITQFENFCHRVSECIAEPFDDANGSYIQDTPISIKLGSFRADSYQGELSIR